MSRERRYPRKGEFGTIEVTCDWCGRPIYGEKPYVEGNYCSYDCYSAGKYDRNICGLITILGLVLIIIGYTIQRVLENSLLGSFLLISIGSTLLLTFIILWLSCDIRNGYNVRNAYDRMQSEIEILEDEKDLSSIHWDIIAITKEIPANEGITRRQIIQLMKRKGVDASSTKVAISELIGGGFLEEVSIGHYTIGETLQKGV